MLTNKGFFSRKKTKISSKVNCISDLFFLPSLSEGTSILMLEALPRGLFVLYLKKVINLK